MKKILKALMHHALNKALNKLNPSELNKIQIDPVRERKHGDFSCNIAMLLAKQFDQKPIDLANHIISAFSPHPAIKTIQAAGSGFINFFLYPAAFKELLSAIFQEKSHYGYSNVLKNQKIHFEFVSSNPTGPLHVGHGRSAAYGAAAADLLSAMGAEVHREYYVNDAGRQIDILTASVFLRGLALAGESIEFPSNCYQGDYIIDIAKEFQKLNKQNKHLLKTPVFEKIRPVNHSHPANNSHKDISHISTPDGYLDQMILNIKNLLGKQAYQALLNDILTIILTDIKQDLTEFGVHYQGWFSERTLWDNGHVEQAVSLMQKKNYLYEKDGALWFKSTQFGDDKDRVVIRENGQYTYFASDIAYFKHKFEHYHTVIIVLGADHHGYVPRLKAIIQALGYPIENFHALLVQFAALYEGKERLSMSTRSGEFVTLRQLREETGKDAARFFYIMRKSDQHLMFDLALAKSHSNDNPVYYIQYAHARIASVFRQLSEKNMTFAPEQGLDYLNLLETDSEKNLLLLLSRYKEIIELAALQYEPHLIAHYLRELAEVFHGYYNSFQFLAADDTLRHARLCLIAAVQQIIANGLQMLGVCAPSSM